MQKIHSEACPDRGREIKEYYNFSCLHTTWVVYCGMDKTLNRKILYDKNKGRADVPVQKKEQSKAAKPIAHLKTDFKTHSSESIVQWINGHPYFKWATMCREIGLDKGNFQRILNNPKSVIPAKSLPKIVEVIKNYGYGE